MWFYETWVENPSSDCLLGTVLNSGLPRVYQEYPSSKRNAVRSTTQTRITSSSATQHGILAQTHNHSCTDKHQQKHRVVETQWESDIGREDADDCCREKAEQLWKTQRWATAFGMDLTWGFQDALHSSHQCFQHHLYLRSQYGQQFLDRNTMRVCLMSEMLCRNLYLCFL